VPAELPHFSQEELASWKNLSYPELALKIVSPFIGEDIPAEALSKIVIESYAQFDHPEVAPLTKLAENDFMLELYHGPTLAFKDFALQVLGRILDYVLIKNDQRVVILGATSGDTGSAALEGCRHSKQVDIFILHPHQRVSEVQRRQMTTVVGDNVFNLAVQGNFDDCQSIVKAAFADQSFLSKESQLVAVNSINWARIMMQIVYYFSAALKVGAPEQAVSFSVPTGNFGDIYAGFLAKSIGLPIKQLVVATNSNDILHRFINDNEYSTTGLSHTLSPSMDILVSSNFERYLFDLFDRDSDTLIDFMSKLGQEPQQVSDEKWQQMRKSFSSARVDDAVTSETIEKVFNDTGKLVDPHTAVGIRAARDCNADPATPMITLSTAHPAKFSDAINKAGLETPELPPHLIGLFEKKEHYTVVPKELAAVTEFVKKYSHS
jgi:threonine synthase